MLDQGARMEPNEHGMTSHKAAAERCQAVMVDFLIDTPRLVWSSRLKLWS